MIVLHTSRPGWKPLAAFGLALGVCVAGFFSARALPESVTTGYPWARQAVSQGLMVAIALAAMALSRRPFAEFGFRRPAPAPGHFNRLLSCPLGEAATGGQEAGGGKSAGPRYAHPVMVSAPIRGRVRPWRGQTLTHRSQS